MRTAAVALALAAFARPLPAAVPAVTRIIPIVLDVAGSGGGHYTTELTLANRGTTPASVQLTYTPASALGASGAGAVNVDLAAGAQLVVPDALAFLRSKGLAIPTGSNQGGTLAAVFSGFSSSDAVYAGARTTTPSGSGRAGLAYPGVDIGAALAGSSYLCGLRNTASDRTNLALVNVGAAPATLRVTLISGAAGDGRSFTVSPDTTLAPGQWTQLNRVLDAPGFTNAYARVDVVSGPGPYLAYAVINDNVTNDGSYVAAQPAAAPAEPLLVPVLVESATFQSDLVLTNPGATAQTVTLRYVESASPSGGAGGTAAVSLAAGQQMIVPGAIDFLRQKNVPLGPKGAATYAGALTVTFSNAGAVSSGFAGARTSAPAAGGGEYGLFSPAVGASAAAVLEAWVYGLEQDAASRSNLAIANLGDASDPISVRVDVYDGATGKLAGSTPATSLPPGGWSQFNAILETWGLARGYARVVKLAGASRFVGYGIVNDGAAPGLGTSDGSFVAAGAVPHTVLGLHNPLDPASAAADGARAVRLNPSTANFPGGIASVQNRVAAYRSLGLTVVVTLTLWNGQKGGHLPDPASAAGQALLQELGAFLGAAGPSIDVLALDNEPMYDVDPADFQSDGAHPAPVVAWYSALAAAAKGAIRGDPRLSALRISAPALNDVEHLAQGGSARAAQIATLLDWASGDANVDAIDVHLHVAAASDVSAALAYLAGVTSKTLIVTEWSQATVAWPWLAAAVAPAFSAKWRVAATTTNQAFLESCYGTPIAKTEWDDFVATAPYDPGFMAAAYGAMVAGRVAIATYGAGIQYGDPKFDTKQLLANLTVVPGPGGVPQENFQFGNWYRALARGTSTP